MRLVSLVLFVLAALAGLGALLVVGFGISAWNDPSGMGPLVTLLAIAAGLVLAAAAGVLVSLGLAARYTAERRATEARGAAPAARSRPAAAADPAGPATPAARPDPKPRRKPASRPGLWLMRSAPFVALAGVAVSVLRVAPLARAGHWDGATTTALVITGALAPIVAGAVMLAVGAKLRRDAPRPPG